MHPGKGFISLRDYELVYILRPASTEELISGLAERLQTWVGASGGEIQKVTTWGRRRLAYPIADVRDGIYTLVHFRAAPTAIKELERNIKLAEDIIRHMIVRQGS